MLQVERSNQTVNFRGPHQPIVPKFQDWDAEMRRSYQIGTECAIDQRSLVEHEITCSKANSDVEPDGRRQCLACHLLERMPKVRS